MKISETLLTKEEQVVYHILLKRRIPMTLNQIRDKQKDMKVHVNGFKTIEHILANLIDVGLVKKRKIAHSKVKTVYGVSIMEGLTYEG